ncbi:MAG: alpha-L-fucosidase [Lentisphaerae bacterium]|nr:MAG: alpha-L-fucosidase [Lentisphaerota bacterium]
MTRLLCKEDYEASIAATRDERMEWFRKARFGMFIHYGLYALYGRNEWVMALENIPVEEYEKRADEFKPKPGCPREWAKLASEAGMKYMVMTTKHHEGFCLWDTKMTDYNAVKRGPKRDIVREYVEACREYGMKIGFYYSLMDWHHPDGGRCAYDSEARQRFLEFTHGCVRELMSNYGKIDILWYDVPAPMQHHEGWDSLRLNQMVRELQPHIIINNRSRLDEDFGTPEGHVRPDANRDWEACMTFNGISWGYIDSQQAAPYSHNVQGILSMLRVCCAGQGNLLLNIGPTPDGSVPPEAVEPLRQTGAWIRQYGDLIYQRYDRWSGRNIGGWLEPTIIGNKVYAWTRIWPHEPAGIGSFLTPLKAARLLPSGIPLSFEQKDQRILLTDLPAECPDKIANRAIIELEFEEPPVSIRGSKCPALHQGKVY